jgi:hypothetical protein
VVGSSTEFVKIRVPGQAIHALLLHYCLPAIYHLDLCRSTLFTQHMCLNTNVAILLMMHSMLTCTAVNHHLYHCFVWTFLHHATSVTCSKALHTSLHIRDIMTSIHAITFMQSLHFIIDFSCLHTGDCVHSLPRGGSPVTALSHYGTP